MQSFLDYWQIPYLVVVAGFAVFFVVRYLRLRVAQDNRSMDADNPNRALVDKEIKPVRL